jgi:hypothetical protein
MRDMNGWINNMKGITSVEPFDEKIDSMEFMTEIRFVDAFINIYWKRGFEPQTMEDTTPQNKSVKKLSVSTPVILNTFAAEFYFCLSKWIVL